MCLLHVYALQSLWALCSITDQCDREKLSVTINHVWQPNYSLHSAPSHICCHPLSTDAWVKHLIWCRKCSVTPDGYMDMWPLNRHPFAHMHFTNISENFPKLKPKIIFFIHREVFYAAFRFWLEMKQKLEAGTVLFVCDEVPEEMRIFLAEAEREMCLKITYFYKGSSVRIVTFPQICKYELCQVAFSLFSHLSILLLLNRR